MEKLNLCIMFGGTSSEHDVSRVSAASVIDNINPEKYNIYTIGITKSGKWLLYEGDTDAMRTGEWESGKCTPAIISPDRTVRGIVAQSGEVIPLDVVFPVLHGKYGEDGTVQGLLALADIPCVGSGVIGSAVCMDKCMAKIVFKNEDIPQADCVELRRGDRTDVELIEKKLGYPCFIKPANAGSSVGVSKAVDREGLLRGIEIAFREDEKILIEEGINAREVECSVIGNENPEAAEVLGEVLPANEFYDYEAKYKNANSKLLIPAPVSDKMRDEIRALAVKAYKACECRGLARVDFLVDKNDGSVRLNEINTIPGFTSISMYSMLWGKAGVGYSELIDRLVGFALDSER